MNTVFKRALVALVFAGMAASVNACTIKDFAKSIAETLYTNRSKREVGYGAAGVVDASLLTAAYIQASKKGISFAKCTVLIAKTAKNLLAFSFSKNARAEVAKAWKISKFIVLAAGAMTATGVVAVGDATYNVARPWIEDKTGIVQKIKDLWNRKSNAVENAIKAVNDLNLEWVKSKDDDEGAVKVTLTDKKYVKTAKEYLETILSRSNNKSIHNVFRSECELILYDDQLDYLLQRGVVFS